MCTFFAESNGGPRLGSFNFKSLLTRTVETGLALLRSGEGVLKCIPPLEHQASRRTASGVFVESIVLCIIADLYSPTLIALGTNKQ